jgi:D-inositol-3-phosphate glycosyltransferase
MRQLAVLSMHTSPLEQAGSGDAGGMNVYVRELSSALSRAGVSCDVYTRAASPDAPASVEVEPGFVVHHVVAGPLTPVSKTDLHELVVPFTDGVAATMARLESEGGPPVEVIHANYWLSGLAGHTLKHRLGLPLVSTFHTLDRVKAQVSHEEADRDDPGRRARAEAEVIGCSDAVMASCSVELDQLVELYGADPALVEIVPPGVDHVLFSPGDRAAARQALGLPPDGPLVLFVGRLQPLKAAGVALRAVATLEGLGLVGARLVVVGGPSGTQGLEEVRALRYEVESAGLGPRVTFVPPQPHERLPAYYRAADCCVVPSRSESFGLVALEAAACGTPVVASAVGGMTTLVEHGRTGYLVESGDVTSFAHYLAEVLSDPRKAAAMGAAAAERARSYTWPVAAARLRRLYGELTSRHLVECL